MFQYFGSHSFSNFIVTDIITHAENLTVFRPIKGEHIYFYFFSIVFFFFISWRLITLQYCSGFCHTTHFFYIWLHPFLILQQCSITFKYMKRNDWEDICNAKTMLFTPHKTTHRQHQTHYTVLTFEPQPARRLLIQKNLRI